MIQSLDSIRLPDRNISCVVQQGSSPSSSIDIPSLIGVKLCFHLYMYVYILVSHQDRLEDMKCFHSCICISVICLDCYEE